MLVNNAGLGHDAPLTDEQQIQFVRGRAIYSATCGACHHDDGQGQAGKAPSLVESPWVNGPTERLVRIALHGLAGPVEVHGQTWDLVMPGLATSVVMNDQRMAAALTYVRRAWGNWGDPIDAQLVAQQRKEWSGRLYPWTVQELLDVEAGKLVAGDPKTTPAPTDPFAKYRDAVTGGDAERGRVLFHTNLQLRCPACHVVGQQGGGFVGPELTDIGARAKRDYLLESLVNPSATIAKGFETIVLWTNDGRNLAGTLVTENDASIVVAPPSGGQITVPAGEVDERFVSPLSSMPPVAELFTVDQLRDLVAYLESLKTADARSQ